MIDRELLTKKEFGLEKVIPDPALPITTRTKSDAEARALVTWALPFLVLCWVGFCVLSVAYLFEPGQPVLSAIIVLAALVAIGVGTAFVYPIFKRRGRDLRTYRDPRISLEVRETGMILRAPGHVHELPFAGAAYTPLWTTARGGTHFWGIRLETPIGPLSIENTRFRSGRRASGAIVRRIEAARG